MTEKEKLIRTLCETPGRELVNVKFSFTPKDGVTEEEFCARVNTVLMRADSGKIEGRSEFGDAKRPLINADDFIKARLA